MTDVSRMGEALARPGMDPRSWVTLAVVDAVNVTATGVYCDITTISNLEETALYAPIYGASSYGLHVPIEVGSFVVVAIPEGEYNAGARIIAQCWDGGHQPPTVVTEHPEDVALVVKPGKSIRVVVTGGGDAVIAAGDAASHVRLGDETATRGVARMADRVDFDWDRIQTILDSRYTPVGSPAGLSATAAATPGDDSAIATASDVVSST